MSTHPADILEANEIGHAYGSALLELAEQHGVLDAIASQVDKLGTLLAQNADFRKLTQTPALSQDDRSGLIDRLFAGKLHELFVKLLHVMNRKGRLSELDATIAAFREQLAQKRGEVTVDAYVATGMDDMTAARVREEIGQSLGKKVTLREHIDESLIGGLKVRIGDQLIDASVAAQLRAVQRKLVEAGRARAKQGA
jgi:F-type H+-transporting ATPase subunit delta